MEEIEELPKMWRFKGVCFDKHIYPTHDDVLKFAKSKGWIKEIPKEKLDSGVITGISGTVTFSGSTNNEIIINTNTAQKEKPKKKFSSKNKKGKKYVVSE